MIIGYLDLWGELHCNLYARLRPGYYSLGVLEERAKDRSGKATSKLYRIPILVSFPQWGLRVCPA